MAKNFKKSNKISWIYTREKNLSTNSPFIGSKCNKFKTFIGKRKKTNCIMELLGKQGGISHCIMCVMPWQHGNTPWTPWSSYWFTQWNAMLPRHYTTHDLDYLRRGSLQCTLQHWGHCPSKSHIANSYIVTLGPPLGLHKGNFGS